MTWHREIPTYIIVTVVTVLIWAWAAGETRERKTINISQMQFVVPDAKNWVIAPGRQSATIVVDGPKVAIEKLERLVRRTLKVNVPAVAGKQIVELLDHLQRQDEIRATGVTIISTEPITTEIELDPIETLSARVKPILPGINAEGEVTVDPPDAVLTLPSSVHAQLGSELFVEAAFQRFELESLPEGERQTLEVKPRLPNGRQMTEGCTIQPGKVKVSFTIRSRTRETKLASVPIILAAVPEDKETTTVSIEPKTFENVVISADADLIRRIENHEVQVVAMLNLSPRERQDRIEAKRISGFLAMVPQPGGQTKAQEVNAKVTDSVEFPSVHVTYTDRTPAKSSKPAGKS